MNNTAVTEQPKASTPVACSDWFGALVDSMKRVEEWEISRYELTHKPTGLILWIANGWMFLEADRDSPIPLSPSLLERVRLWQHVKRLRNIIMAQKLSAPNDKADRPAVKSAGAQQQESNEK